MDRRLFCVRPMCGGAAAAVLHYDYADRTAWLDPILEEPAPGAWAICAAHAERLKVPSGWTLVDRRTPAAAGGMPLAASSGMSTAASRGMPAQDRRPRSEVGYRPPLAV